MDNTLLRIENKAKDTVKLISLLRNNGVDVAEVEHAIQQVKQKIKTVFNFALKFTQIHFSCFMLTTSIYGALVVAQLVE